MTYKDTILLFAAYAGLIATVFALVWAPISLWRFYKSLGDPGMRHE